MKNLKYSWVVILTFLFIYYPPIIQINILHLLAVISWFHILRNYRKHASGLVYQYNYLKDSFFLLNILFYLYIMLLFNQNYNILIGYDIVIIIFEIIPIAYLIVDNFNTCKGKRQFYDLLLHVGLLQGIIAVIAFVVPEFQTWVINRMLNYGFRDIIVWMSGHRMYGFGYNFAYTFPIVQASLAVLSIYLSIYKKAKYILFTPILIFSGVINARSSLVVLLIGLALILFKFLNSRMKSKIRAITILFIIVFISIPALNYISELSPKTYAWIIEGGEEIRHIFTGDFSGSYSGYITSVNNYRLPDDIALLFGTSERTIRGNNLYQSDVGFINDIWMGGLIYALLIYFYLFYKIKQIQNNFNKYSVDGKLLSLFLLSIIIAANFKGVIFKQNEFINLFFLINIFSFSLSSAKQNSNN